MPTLKITLQYKYDTEVGGVDCVSRFHISLLKNGHATQSSLKDS